MVKQTPGTRQPAMAAGSRPQQSHGESMACFWCLREHYSLAQASCLPIGCRASGARVGGGLRGHSRLSLWAFWLGGWVCAWRAGHFGWSCGMCLSMARWLLVWIPVWVNLVRCEPQGPSTIQSRCKCANTSVGRFHVRRKLDVGLGTAPMRVMRAVTGVRQGIPARVTQAARVACSDENSSQDENRDLGVEQGRGDGSSLSRPSSPAELQLQRLYL